MVPHLVLSVSVEVDLILAPQAELVASWFQASGVLGVLGIYGLI